MALDTFGIPLILLHIFEVISLLLYANILCILLRNSKFKTSFWRIFSISATIDLFYFLLSFFFYRLPLLPEMQGFYAGLPASRWISLGMFLAFLAIYQQFFLHTLISLNRFTGVCFPFQHEWLWTNHMKRGLGGSFIIAVVFAINRLFTVGQFTPLIATDLSKGYTPIPVQYDFFPTRQTLITIGIGSICAFSCLALNSISLFTIVKRRQKLQMNSMYGQWHSASEKIETSLFLITLWTMLIQFLMATFELLIYLFLNGAYAFEYFDGNEAEHFHKLFAQIPWIIDLYSLSQPWIVLLVSTELRNCAFPWLAKLIKETKNIKSVAPTPSIAVLTK